MSKVAAIAVSLKAAMLVAAGAFARGDMLPVILISTMFELGLQVRHKPDHREATCARREVMEIARTEPPAPARKSGRPLQNH